MFVCIFYISVTNLCSIEMNRSINYLLSRSGTVGASSTLTSYTTFPVYKISARRKSEMSVHAQNMQKRKRVTPFLLQLQKYRLLIVDPLNHLLFFRDICRYISAINFTHAVL